MGEPSVASPHRPPIGRGDVDPGRADYIRIVCGLDPKSRATLELQRAKTQLDLARRGWDSAVTEYLSAHLAAWEYESAGKPTPTAVVRHREQAEHDFKLALKSLRHLTGKTWGLERILCRASETNGGRR